MLVILFGTVQIARVFYIYHTLQKALRGGAGLVARASNVNYCDAADMTLADARTLIEGRPCAALARCLFPDADGELPAGALPSVSDD